MCAIFCSIIIVVSLQPVFTCLLLIWYLITCKADISTVDLVSNYILVKLIYQLKWVVCEFDRSNHVCTYTIKAVFDTYVFGACADCYATVDTDFYGRNISSQITARLWNSTSWWLRQMFQLCLHRPRTSVCSCSIFAPKAEISPKLATQRLKGLLMHCMSFYFHAISACIGFLSYSG